MRAHFRPRGRTRVLLAATLVFAVGACGSDDETSSEPATSGSSAPATSTAASAAGGDDEQITAGCAVDAEIESAFSGAPFPDGEPTAEEIQTIRDYMTAEVGPLIERAEQLDIPEIEADIETVVAPIRAFIETGDAAVFESEDDPASSAASASISKFFFDNCEGDKIEVSATDYAFSGPKGQVTAAPFRVKLTNDGKEAHEFAVFRKADGVTDSFDEILALPEEEAGDKIAFIGVVEPIDPGEENYAVIPIDQPGEYIAVCFIPVGATTVAAGETAQGPPHFVQGMKIEFTAS